MFKNSFPVKIVSDFSEISVKNCVVELRQNSSVVEVLSKFGISLSTELLEKNTHREESEKTFIFYPENKNIFQLICFFPTEKNLTDDRSEIFQKYKNDILYIPDGNEIDAYEIFTLATYEFLNYKTEKLPVKKYFFTPNFSEKQAEFDDKKNLLEAILMARDLVNMPPHDANPESMVKFISERKWKHFDVEIFGEAELRQLGCNLIRAVGYGSVRESAMVILKPKKWLGTEKYALIGKGVTFDSGGIQIKPDKYMLDMKCDMAGSAGLLGVAMYLDSLEKLPQDVIIGLGFVENMTGSAAYKPLDIYTAYNGKTVEIHHTDAEWRLVLADVMSYVEKNYNVEHIVTMATLTGACIYALGNNISAIMGDDEDFISTMIDNTSPYEKIWRLPVEDAVKNSLKSEVADIKNLSEEKAGASVGTAFLSHFQGNAKLTHLDIAGPAYRTKNFGYMPVGGTGWGVKKISEVLLSLSK